MAVGWFLFSPTSWELRLTYIAIYLTLIWNVIPMSEDMLLYTPWEVVPMIFLISLVVSALFVFKHGLIEFNCTNKEQLRNGLISEKLKYAWSYLAGNIATIVIAVIGSVLIPGLVYDAVGFEFAESGAILIALAFSALMGISGIKHINDFVDLFKDIGKIDTLLQKKE